MNVVKVTKIGEDGTIEFEGVFGPNEVQFVLETGVNFLLKEGAMSVLDQQEEEEDDPFEGLVTIDENTPPRH